MKYRKFLFALMLCLILSCATSGDIVPSRLFFISEYSEIFPASEEKPDEYGLNINLKLLNTDRHDLIDVIFNTLYDGATTEEYAEKLIKNESEFYRETVAEFEDDWGFFLSWEYEENHSWTMTHSWLVISRNIYYYGGGAHGIHAVKFYTIDLDGLELYSPDRFIQPDGISTLETMLTNDLKQYSEREEIILWDDYEISEFFPAKDGLHFWWNVYEITAYAYGPVEIIIEWNRLDAILSPAGKKLAAAFRTTI